MAAVAIVDGTPMRFEAGGVFTLTDGSSNAYTFLSLEPGTLEFQDGNVKVLTYTDRGTQKTPLLGDDELSMIKVSGKFAKTTGGKSPMDLSNDNDTTNGLMTLYTLLVKIPYVKGGSTGVSLTWANSFFKNPVRYKAGADFDTYEMEFNSLAKAVTEATY